MINVSLSALRGAAVAAAGLVLAPAALALVEPASVTVIVDGLRSNAGAVEISLYDSEAGWNGTGALETALIEAPGPVRAVFDALPAGDYAVRVYHDADGDGQLDTSMMGIPSERYGFSAGARPRFRGARFDEAMFTLAPGETRHERITLQGAMDG